MSAGPELRLAARPFHLSPAMERLAFLSLSGAASAQRGCLGALAGYLSFAALYWLYRRVRGHEGLGYGDIKYLAALGAWHGWRMLPQLVLVASLLAGMTWVILGLSARCGGNRKWEKNNPLPFGPFLAAAGFWCGWQTLANLTL